MQIVARSLRAADLQTIADARPDLIIIDPGFGRDVFQTMSAIGQREDGPKVLVFSTEANVDYAMKTLECGASGFLPITASADDVQTAVETVLSGEVYLDPKMANGIVSAMRMASARRAAPNPVKLSVREKQIVDQLKLGKTNREIAAALQVSEKTIKHYMTLLMQKVDARNRLEVAMRFNTEGAPGRGGAPPRRRATDVL